MTGQSNFKNKEISTSSWEDLDNAIQHLHMILDKFMAKLTSKNTSEHRSEPTFKQQSGKGSCTRIYDLNKLPEPSVRSVQIQITKTEPKPQTRRGIDEAIHQKKKKPQGILKPTAKKLTRQIVRNYSKTNQTTFKTYATCNNIFCRTKRPHQTNFCFDNLYDADLDKILF